MVTGGRFRVVAEHQAELRRHIDRVRGQGSDTGSCSSGDGTMGFGFH